MKKITALIMAAAMLMAFAACKSEKGGSSDTAVPAASAEAAAPAAVNVDVSAVWASIEEKLADKIPDTESLDDEGLSAMIGIDATKLSSYVYRFPLMNVSATEFFIAECKDGEVDSVKEQVLERQKALEEQWSRYLPEQYDLVKAYTLEIRGNYLLFCVTEYTDEVMEIFNSYFA